MQAKDRLRQAAISRRAALSAGDRAAAAEAYPVLLHARLAAADRVAAYAAVGSEPATAGLVELCREVLLPVLRTDGDLDWAVAGELAPGRRGLLEPTGPRLGVDAIASCDVVLVPALAVDRAGNRLGRGGGSYDRALRRFGGLTIALLYDGEITATLPAEPHDVPIGAAVTPSDGLLRF